MPVSISIISAKKNIKSTCPQITELSLILSPPTTCATSPSGSCSASSGATRTMWSVCSPMPTCPPMWLAPIVSLPTDAPSNPCAASWSCSPRSSLPTPRTVGCRASSTRRQLIRGTPYFSAPWFAMGAVPL